MLVSQHSYLKHFLTRQSPSTDTSNIFGMMREQNACEWTFTLASLCETLAFTFLHWFKVNSSLWYGTNDLTERPSFPSTFPGAFTLSQTLCQTSITPQTQLTGPLEDAISVFCHEPQVFQCLEYKVFLVQVPLVTSEIFRFRGSDSLVFSKETVVGVVPWMSLEFKQTMPWLVSPFLRASTPSLTDLFSW